MPTPRPSHLLFLAACAAAGLTTLAAAAQVRRVAPTPKPAAQVDFNRDIRPIISAKCYACHGPDEETRAAGLRLDLRSEAVKARSGREALVPGKPDASRVYIRITAKEPAQRMPPPKSGHEVTPAEAQLIRRWIQEGAQYAEHWAFRAPRRPPLPAVKGAAWARNPIDRFILARLEKAGMRPGPEADRYTLIRRVSLDLTGLPPTPAEVERFVGDRSPEAYEKLVDRLLSSPHYGERWARMWMDLARYADSAGYGSDPLRMNIWPYREWVIQAFNRNLAYDQFTLEQIAGDLLPNPTPDQLTATAFHRNTMTNTEGGTDDEEFRMAAVRDRAATTAQVWMGLTMGCAQCHTHKFDPISHREYYQFLAFFNQSEDSDRGDEYPTLPIPSASQRAEMDRLKGELAGMNKQYETPTPEFRAELAAWEEAQRRPLPWSILETVEARSASGEALERLPEGFLRGGKETYTIRVRVPQSGATALRLELPAENAGVKLADVRVTSGETGPAKARYIRVENPGAERILSLAEVQVVSGGANIAPKGKARQSSTAYEGPAHLAIDGNTSGEYFTAKSTTHTATEKDPWWEVDLGAEVPVQEVTLWNRTDGGSGERLSNFRVLALGADRKPIWETKQAGAPNPSVRLSVSGARAVPLRNASATSELTGFEASKAIDADLKTAWHAGDAGVANAAVWELASPAAAGEVLNVTLVQGSESQLGRFRFQAVASSTPVRELPAQISRVLSIPAEQRTEAGRTVLHEYFRPFAASLEPLRKEIARTKTALAGIKAVDVPVMRELPAQKRRPTHIALKGNYLNPGDSVQAAVPAAFHRLPDGASLDRLGLARWLVSPENPLTARVAVNRFWAQLFGTGLVDSEEDFGSQGSLPTHPELLDWLAVTFAGPGGAEGGLGWDMKALLKLMVTSATYRQSSRVLPEHLERDPRNRLLSRFPRRRLDAEGVRDQALALSGLLTRKIGGPSVYPPQPDGLWRAAFNGQRTWPTSTGEDRYRRGMYTFWRRTVPYPSMATFDAPSREICAMRRIPTNTPLQALVTLNDPAYVEMSQALSRRIMKEGGSTPADRARYALRLALCRPPSEEQVTALLALHERELTRYRGDAEAAKKLSSDPLGPLPTGLDPAEAAAWTVVGNVLLNLDGVLSRS